MDELQKSTYEHYLFTRDLENATIGGQVACLLDDVHNHALNVDDAGVILRDIITLASEAAYNLCLRDVKRANEFDEREELSHAY